MHNKCVICSSSKNRKKKHTIEECPSNRNVLIKSNFRHELLQCPFFGALRLFYIFNNDLNMNKQR